MHNTDTITDNPLSDYETDKEVPDDFPQDKLRTYTVANLARVCEDLKLDAVGTRRELLDRIYDDAKTVLKDLTADELTRQCRTYELGAGGSSSQKVNRLENFKERVYNDAETRHEGLFDRLLS